MEGSGRTPYFNLVLLLICAAMVALWWYLHGHIVNLSGFQKVGAVVGGAAAAVLGFLVPKWRDGIRDRVNQLLVRKWAPGVLWSALTILLIMNMLSSTVTLIYPEPTSESPDYSVRIYSGNAEPRVVERESERPTEQSILLFPTWLRESTQFELIGGRPGFTCTKVVGLWSHPSIEIPSGFDPRNLKLIRIFPGDPLYKRGPIHSESQSTVRYRLRVMAASDTLLDTALTFRELALGFDSTHVSWLLDSLGEARLTADYREYFYDVCQKDSSWLEGKLREAIDRGTTHVVREPERTSRLRFEVIKNGDSTLVDTSLLLVDSISVQTMILIGRGAE